jgi:hypothetical protein
LGKIIQFERRQIAACETHEPAQLGLETLLRSNVERIDAATEGCHTLLRSLKQLSHILDSLEGTQIKHVESSDRQALKEQIMSARCQLSGGLAKLTDQLRILGEAAEKASKVDALLKRS